MNVVDFVSEDVDHNINYLTIMVYFGEHQLNTMTAHTMMKFLSDKHVWRNSTDRLAVDLNGVIITNYDPTKAGVIKLPTQEEDTTDGTR